MGLAETRAEQDMMEGVDIGLDEWVCSEMR